MSYHYRRIIGGIGWPRLGKPGAVVVVGEDHIKDKNAGRRPLYVLDEAEKYDVLDLYETCITFQQEHPEVKWFANCANPLASVFDERNRKNQFRRKPGVRLDGVPAAYMDFNMVTSIIMQRVKSDKKTLYLGKYTFLTARLFEIGMEHAYTSPLEDLPAITALGLTISHLDLNEPMVARRVLNVSAGGWT